MTRSSALRTADVARILGLSPARVRALVRDGLCQPQRKGSALEFSFADLVLLRTASGLLQASVPPRQVRRSLRELARQLPADRPLTGFRVYADGRHVVARDDRGAWQPESGQAVFLFDVDQLSRETRRVAKIKGRRPEPLAPQRGTKPPDAHELFAHAVELEHGGDRDGAAAAYRQALAHDPTLADAAINLGRLLHESGHRDQAIRLYRQALEHTPDDPTAHYNLAIALEDQGDGPGAARHYHHATELAPDFADAHFNLAQLLERLGKRTDALQHLAAYRRLVSTRSPGERSSSRRPSRRPPVPS